MFAEHLMREISVCAVCAAMLLCFYAAVAIAGRENSNALDGKSLLPKITKI